MVGNGADDEIMATLDDDEGRILLASKLLELNNGWSAVDVEPDRSMDTAAEVVLAMVVASGGIGWL